MVAVVGILVAVGGTFVAVGAVVLVGAAGEVAVITIGVEEAVTLVAVVTGIVGRDNGVAVITTGVEVKRTGSNKAVRVRFGVGNTNVGVDRVGKLQPARIPSRPVTKITGNQKRLFLFILSSIQQISPTNLNTKGIHAKTMPGMPKVL